ncbi:tail assembly protein [Pragia fontium]|uniref:Tail assembly protein n=1 Tax=Pragia fontium TaxID=82985 RepID=A0ABQ5LFY1_9GAMM|nr:tail fiber assembly protein [Pragia fontium]GKX62294.1 tail assembly protein [Pragia fontium]
MNNIQFDKYGLANNEGIIRVYNIDPVTGEYLNSTDELLVAGIGLPQYSYLDEPFVSRAGFAVCRRDGEWQYIEDHRGETAYVKHSGAEQIMSELGPIPAELTLLKPMAIYDKWHDDRWVTDKNAEHQAEVDTAKIEKQQRDEQAKDEIVRLSDAIEFGIELDDDRDRLTAWRKYRILLNRVDIETAPNIQWPEQPE